MHSPAKLILPSLLLMQWSGSAMAYCGQPTVEIFLQACDQLVCGTPWTSSPVAAQDAGEKFCVNGLPAFPSCGTCLSLPGSALPERCCNSDDYAACFAKLAAANCGSSAGGSSGSGSSGSGSSGSGSSGSAATTSAAASSPSGSSAAASDAGSSSSAPTASSGSGSSGSSSGTTSSASAGSTHKSGAASVQATQYTSLMAIILSAIWL